MYQYPYGNAQQLNLDWILNKIQELEIVGGEVDLEEVANALVSASYDTGHSYSQYDYCFYNNKLYRCLNATTGAWNPSDWTEAPIGDDVSILTRLINSAVITDVKFDTSGTNGKLQQKYGASYHDVVEVDYTPVQNSKRPLSSNAGYDLNGALNSVETYMAFIINGNKSTTSIPLAQYAIVKNSTITNITDGLYIAAKAIPANTAIDSTYLTAVNSGGFNSIRSAAYGEATRDPTNTTEGSAAYFIQNGIVYMQGYVNVANRTFANGDIIVTNMPKPAGDIFILCVDANTSGVVPLFLERSTRTLKAVTGFPSAGHYIYFTGCFMYDPS